MARLLFADQLDKLHPESMLRTEARPHLTARRLGQLTAKPPSNQEILDAAKAAYHANSDAVDASTLSGLKYAQSSQGQPNVAALNAFNWKARQAAPITPTTQQVYAAADMQPAVEAAKSNSSIYSMTIGISESAQVILGEEGGIGIAIELDNSGIVNGMGYAAGKLGLDIDVALNLQVGLWNCKPASLAGAFYGLEVNLDLEVGVSLGIYMTPTLGTFGFSVGVGVGVGGGATVVGGYTWIF